MPMMAASEAAASTRHEQALTDHSGDQWFFSSTCPAHRTGACFQCYHAMQYSAPPAIIDDQAPLSVYNSSPQAAFLSWIKAIDPHPPRPVSTI